MSGGGQGPLGIFAGAGALPLRVAAVAEATGRGVRAVLLEGFAEPSLWAPYRSITLRLGALGSSVEWLKAEGVRELVLAGQVRRPSMLSLRPDVASAKYLARIGKRAFAGDDGLLSALRDVLREEGFSLTAPNAVLDGLQQPPGLLTRAGPDAHALSDIARGVEVVQALGALDVGQGAVVQQGLVLAVEAFEGTDAMLARCGPLRREGPGGVLVKLVKPGQDRRLDLPTIGPATVRHAVEAGLAGIAFEAGGALVMEREETVRLAEERGVFLLALRPEDHMPRRGG
ncbi:UDP-2,3-diacylglucosamine diphosphatase LpxI [Roseomonas sp. OT10]|uniref:LpxI family protein n=1 Tax=Roseomonas cutis TaxID=2897332 RepID=UPI001E604E13|nr:UDP-2,3-diacylglucosamine diphosphatase LpxI [Roseomonas sp. OT10]UFN50822.1 UDP-2,3-diacylglucosamine diphosphatase LpxI [Roseomonas sp. OT10]